MTAEIRAVSPANIQSELNRIWESLETTNVARACLFNLVFFTRKDHRTSYIQRIAQSVVEKFPSRVIFIIADKEEKEAVLKTEVSILTASKGEYDVACDYIQVESGGEGFDRVPFIVLPHILPDLPVYLVWSEDPSKEDPLCSQLKELAQRIIFDSEATDDLVRYAKSVLKHYEESRADVADLNWARMENWRDVFSRTFYTDERLQQIKGATQIRIEYNGAATPFFCHTKIQSIYLQTWLASQLQWKFLSVRNEKEALTFNYTGEHGPIEIQLAAVNVPELPPGLILSVEIATDSQNHFSLQRSRTLLHQITLVSSNASQCELPCNYLFPKTESGHSLVKEICHKGSSKHYLGVLKLLTQMQGGGLC